MDEGWLAAYLNNHVAGSAAGMELIRRAVANSRGTPAEDFLCRLSVDLEEEQALLGRLIRASGGREETFRKLGAWALEKTGLLRIGDYSRENPLLGRLVEFEALLLGSVGRVGMWRLMENCFPGDPRFAFADFRALRERGERHLQELERFRIETARELAHT